MFLTIFTAVHDHARLLPQMYSNLLVQFCSDFEWIIVISASDQESINIVNQWIAANEMNIVLFVQKDPGRHLSYNYALKQAKGELFFSLEPEDFVTGEFVEELKAFWQQTYHSSEYRLFTHESIDTSPKQETPIQNPSPALIEPEEETPKKKKRRFSLFQKGIQMGKSRIHIESEPFSFHTIFKHIDRFQERRRTRNFQKEFNVVPSGKITYMKQAEEDISHMDDFTIFRSKMAQDEEDLYLKEQEAAAASAAVPEPEPEPEPEPAPPESPSGPLIPEKITMAEINANWSSANIRAEQSRLNFEVDDKWIGRKLFKQSEDEDFAKSREICGIIALARSTKGERIGTNLPLDHSVTFYGSTMRVAKPWQIRKRLSRHIVSPYHLPVVRAVIYRTEILKKYSFPVFTGEKYIRDEVLYYQPDDTYALLPYPRDILVRPVLTEFLEGLPILQKMIANPVGSQAFFGERIDLSRGFVPRALNMIQYLGFRTLRRSREYAYTGPYRHELIFYRIPGFFYGLYLCRQRNRQQT